MIPFFTLIITTLLSLAVVFGIKKFAIHYRIGSLPSPRKLHTEFKPLLGGISFFLTIICAVILAQLFNQLPSNIWSDYQFFWLGLVIILLTGIFDDIKGLSSWTKFLGQGIAAGLLILGGCRIQSFGGPLDEVLNLGMFSIPFSFMWIIFIINSINLLDGLDGLAGGVCLIITLGILFISNQLNQYFLLFIGIGLAGGIIGFLKYNRHPATIFMGEVGSLQLGYILAFFSIEAMKIASTHQVFFLVSLVLLGVPLTDTLISFLRRLEQGKSPFAADKEHIHHRLMKLGLSHSQTVWFMYLLTAFYVVFALIIFIFKGILGLVLFAVAFFLAFFWIYRLGYIETRITLQNFAHQLHHVTSPKPRAPLHFNRLWQRIVLFLVDIGSVSMSLFIFYWLKFESGIFSEAIFRPLSEYFFSPVFILILFGWLTLFYLNNLYHLEWDVSRFEKTWRTSKVITFGVLALGIITLDFQQLATRSQFFSLLSYWIIMIISVNAGRLIIIEIEKRLRIFDYSPRRTLIVGWNDLAKKVYQDITYNPHLIFEIKGFVSKKVKDEKFLDLPVLGDYSALPEIIHHHKIEEVIIALPESASQDFINILSLCEPQGVKIKTLPGSHEMLTNRQANLVGHAFIQIFSENMVLWQWVIKRITDMVISVIFMVLLLPFFLMSAILIYLKFKKSVFIRLNILGKNGIPFKMFVFRLTVENYHYQDNPVYLGLTPLSPNTGKFAVFLFQYRLYKLPQLINVFLGDMSLVGPRPEPIEWYQEFSSRLLFLHRRITIRPGLTGLAQVKYHYELAQKALEEWIKYDIYYTENLSLRMDLRILLRSVLMLIVKPYQELPLNPAAKN
ncbi:MAG: hypothetical protein A2Y94_01685 [Caldithrix sp. RBG_13_44_9]|nr:MAG: hypothetical protein A2Y94_01685 [Caldithrix sp. RBG_13_44_9]